MISDMVNFKEWWPYFLDSRPKLQYGLILKTKIPPYFSITCIILGKKKRPKIQEDGSNNAGHCQVTSQEFESLQHQEWSIQHNKQGTEPNPRQLSMFQVHSPAFGDYE